ncbi:hypothetical protein ACFXOD_36660 [Streptomyces sp. NPDC059161]|uniref:hypothetical protein n=1 Tax=Streptomyces sp. NPDC059161 TaxID=3346749 RepID=UPI0036BCA11E
MTIHPARYRVSLQFTPPGGPAVTGYWDEQATAERKWRADIGVYGSHETALITLSELLEDGSWRVVVDWTRDAGA